MGRFNPFKDRAKREYNATLDRANKAMDWMDQPTTPWDDIEKHRREFFRVISRLDFMLKLIGDYESENILNGFNW